MNSLGPHFNPYLCASVLFSSPAVGNTDPAVLTKYRAGFSECVVEVTRFLSTCEGLNAEVTTRLLSHLAACVTQIGSVNLFHPGALGRTGTQTPASSSPQPSPESSSHAHVSPDAVKVFGSFQVVPSPDGQFAFLVPGAALTPLTVQNFHHMSPAAPAATADSVWRPW